MVTTSGILGAQLTVKEPDFDQKNQLMTKQEKEKNLMVQQNKIRILFNNNNNNNKACISETLQCSLHNVTKN